jgi:hypothetical protein
VDESVCHLQDSSFQSSLGREGAVPVWVGMGWLETKSRDFLQSKQCTARHSLIQLTRASHPSFTAFGTAALAIIGFFMRE